MAAVGPDGRPLRGRQAALAAQKAAETAASGRVCVGEVGPQGGAAAAEDSFNPVSRLTGAYPGAARPSTVNSAPVVPTFSPAAVAEASPGFDRANFRRSCQAYTSGEFKKAYEEYRTKYDQVANQAPGGNWAPAAGVEGNGTMHLRFLSLQAQWRQMEWSADLHARHKGLDIDDAAAVAALSGSITWDKLDEHANEVLNELYDGVLAGSVLKHLGDPHKRAKAPEERCFRCDTPFLPDVIEDSKFCRKCGSERAASSAVPQEEAKWPRFRTQLQQSPGRPSTNAPASRTAASATPRGGMFQHSDGRGLAAGHGCDPDRTSRPWSSGAAVAQKREELKEILAETSRLEAFLTAQIAKGCADDDRASHKRFHTAGEFGNAAPSDDSAIAFVDTPQELRRAVPSQQPCTGETLSDLPVGGLTEGYENGQPLSAVPKANFCEVFRRLEAEVDRMKMRVKENVVENVAQEDKQAVTTFPLPSFSSAAEKPRADLLPSTHRALVHGRAVVAPPALSAARVTAAGMA